MLKLRSSGHNNKIYKDACTEVRVTNTKICYGKSVDNVYLILVVIYFPTECCPNYYIPFINMFSHSELDIHQNSHFLSLIKVKLYARHTEWRRFFLISIGIYIIKKILQLRNTECNNVPWTFLLRLLPSFNIWDLCHINHYVHKCW